MKPILIALFSLATFSISAQTNNNIKFSFSINGGTFMPIQAQSLRQVNKNDSLKFKITDRKNRVYYYDSCTILLYHVNDVKESKVAIEETVKSKNGDAIFYLGNFFQKCTCDKIELKFSKLYYKNRNKQSSYVTMDQSKRTLKFYL